MLPTNGVDYKIRLGNTLLDSNNSVQYQTLRCFVFCKDDFKPQSISDYSRHGKADINEPTNQDNGPPIEISFQPLPQYNLPQSFFKGNCERKTDDLSYDCILIWDETRREFVLEKLQTTIFVTKTDGSKLSKTPLAVNNVDKKRKPVVEEIGNGVSYPQEQQIQQQQPKRTKVETVPTTSSTLASSTMAPQSMSTFSSMPKSLSSMNGQTYIEEEDDDDASESESDDDDD